MNTGVRRRLRRILGEEEKRTLIGTLDHPLTIGRIDSVNSWSEIINAYSVAKANAILAHVGRLQYLESLIPTHMSVIAHLSGGSKAMDSARQKTLLSGPEAAARVGAEGVSAHLQLGEPNDLEQLNLCAQLCQEAALIGLPVLLMVYHQAKSQHEAPMNVRHQVELAADIGASVVKVDVRAHKADLSLDPPMSMLGTGT